MDWLVIEVWWLCGWALKTRPNSPYKWTLHSHHERGKTEHSHPGYRQRRAQRCLGGCWPGQRIFPQGVEVVEVATNSKAAWKETEICRLFICMIFSTLKSLKHGTLCLYLTLVVIETFWSWQKLHRQKKRHVMLGICSSWLTNARSSGFALLSLKLKLTVLTGRAFIYSF